MPQPITAAGELNREARARSEARGRKRRSVSREVRYARIIAGAFTRARSTITGAQDAVEQMADDLRTLAASMSSITADDLELLGWTVAQITAHGSAARRQAQRDAAERRQ